ncbi:MAG: ABC transporter ATP-binding protein [Minisyncoccia bacterium]
MRSIWRDDLPRTAKPVDFFLFISKPHWRSAAIAMGFVFFAAVVQGFIPYLYKLVTDGAILLAKGNYEPLMWAGVAYIVVATLDQVLWRASGFAGAYWATGARATARATLFSFLSNHSYQYFSNRFAGSLLSKIKQAADGSKDLVELFLWEFFSFAVTLITSLIIIFLTSPAAGFILVAFLVIAVPMNYFIAKRRIPLSIASQNAETALNGATVDSISNIFAVHEYAKRDFENDRVKSLALRRRSLGLRNWHFGEWMLLANGLVVHVFMGAMIVLAVYLAIQGEITPGDVSFFLATVWLLEAQFIFLGRQFNRASELWGQIRESLDDILVEHDVVDRPGAIAFSPEDARIAFNDVSFEYEGVPIFENLSFAIGDGERVGIVGRSGAGKTTLIKLILRHYDLLKGEIRIGNQNITLVTKESLRSAVAVVPQEPTLFHRTIAENIAYSHPGASHEDIVRAAERAQAHEFIRSLPAGYESLVGERGIKLSGGQRQRIAIARAFLKDAPVLLLDEATSALDSESEALVQKALLTLMQGRTVIAIAHRLSTLRVMDRLLVFDKGEIIEDGTHDGLLAKGGIYATLWNHQAGGFLTEE